MSAQHTPGPWVAAAHIVYSGPHRVATVQAVGAQANADATLIAAAPELLEALVAATWELPVGGPTRDNALAAIAKARGNP